MNLNFIKVSRVPKWCRDDGRFVPEGCCATGGPDEDGNEGYPQPPGEEDHKVNLIQTNKPEMGGLGAETLGTETFLVSVLVSVPVRPKMSGLEKVSVS